LAQVCRFFTYFSMGGLPFPCAVIPHGGDLWVWTPETRFPWGLCVPPTKQLLGSLFLLILLSRGDWKCTPDIGGGGAFLTAVLFPMVLWGAHIFDQLFLLPLGGWGDFQRAPPSGSFISFFFSNPRGFSLFLFDCHQHYTHRASPWGILSQGGGCLVGFFFFWSGLKKLQVWVFSFSVPLGCLSGFEICRWSGWWFGFFFGVVGLSALVGLSLFLWQKNPLVFCSWCPLPFPFPGGRWNPGCGSEVVFWGRVFPNFVPFSGADFGGVGCLQGVFCVLGFSLWGGVGGGLGVVGAPFFEGSILWSLDRDVGTRVVCIPQV